MGLRIHWHEGLGMNGTCGDWGFARHRPAAKGRDTDQLAVAL